MRTNKAVFFGGTLLLALAGLAISEDSPVLTAPTKPDRAQKAQTPAAPLTVTSAATAAETPVIVYIERRGQTIAVKSGPKGPIYSVKTADGKVLFENLSVEQLRAQAPELHQFIKSAMAGSSGRATDASARFNKDARVRLEALGP
jgi:hypothetical protein